MPPQCGAFSRDLQDKSQSPLFPGGGGGAWLQMTSALQLNSTVKPMFSDHIKQVISGVSDRCLLIAV